jgi:hypothetical protein
MAKFLTKLNVEEISDTAWMVMSPLVIETDYGQTISVPAGFITDFASVPRLPMVYTLFGDTAHEAAVVHDYLYSVEAFPRASADSIFLSAMKATSVAAWRRYPMFLAVRIFGGVLRGKLHVS